MVLTDSSSFFRETSRNCAKICRTTSDGQAHKPVDDVALRHELHKAAASVVSGFVAVKAEVNRLNVWTVREKA